MKTVDLCGEWKLYYAPEEGDMPRDPAALKKAGWPCVPARVPGDAQLDLVRAGVEEDPYYGENLYRFRKYEFCRWWYERSFFMPSAEEGARYVLCFGGIDTFADVFLNGVKVGSADDMFIEHEYDVTGALAYGAENELHVCIRSAVNEARLMEYPACVSGESDEYTQIRKPPSSFGWDILCRLVTAGLWRGVWIRKEAGTRLTEVYTATLDVGGGCARQLFRVRFACDRGDIDGMSVRVSGACGESRFCAEKPMLFTSGEVIAEIRDPALWWPRGYGDAALYDVKVELLCRGETADRREFRIGIRTLEVEHVMKAGDEGEFRIVCSGVPILAKGSNWVPLDALHSRDADRYDRAVGLLRDANCNIVRCWGGNVYEDDRFFDLCDEYGIMVWQDFAMACAVYPDTDRLRGQLAREAASVIRKLRNHPSLLLWAGDNECDAAFFWKKYPTRANMYNPLTREVLPRAVRLHDPYRPFIPSSPYIEAGLTQETAPEQHTWGARAYFKSDFYAHTLAHFTSECGYHGCPAPSSLRRFIPEEALFPRVGSSVWKTHDTDYLPGGERGYDRIALMTDQVKIFFGEAPDDLERFSRLSQAVQAEAKKFFIESTRLKKWRRTGIIWWNMLDGWPQISDAVVDYYFTKKLAYHYIRRVQRPVCLMMGELEDWTRAVVLGNDSRFGAHVEWRVEDGDTGRALLEGETFSPANENVTVGQLREMAGEKKLYVLRWRIDGREYANHYLAGFPHFDADTVLGYVEKIRRLPEPFEWEM